MRKIKQIKSKQVCPKCRKKQLYMTLVFGKDTSGMSCRNCNFTDDIGSSTFQQVYNYWQSTIIKGRNNMQQTGSCAWPKCKLTGQNWQDGKCYCKKHYNLAMMKQMVTEDKPVGKAAIGASTVVINDSG